MEDPAKPRRTGRPLSFDRDRALRAAMLAFWRSGYETTSIADLTAAMGISPPSLYAAFGDKRRLFLEAMRLYAGDPQATEQAFLAAPSAREATHEALRAAAILYTGDDTPRGCLVASAVASGSAAAADVRDEATEVRRTTEAALLRRIDIDMTNGLLPPDTPAPILAALTVAVLQGMSVLARDGAPRERLLALADQAMLAWPQ